MAEHQLDERRAINMQFGTFRPANVVCSCGMHMIVTNLPDTITAVCYNKACQHYRIVWEVEYPQALLAVYTDTKQL